MDDRGREGSVSPFVDEISGQTARQTSVSMHSGPETGRHSIDSLFGVPQEILAWEPVRPPPALGELLDSRYMLPLSFPSDPRMLTALPGKLLPSEDEKGGSELLVPSDLINGSGKRHHDRTSWRLKNRKLRGVGISMLERVDGVRSVARWARPVAFEEEVDQEPHPYASGRPGEDELKVNVYVTSLTRKPSGRNKSRHSMGEMTPIEPS